MTEPPPRYRTRDRPGPGLATIVAPDGRVALWALNFRGTRRVACAQCGAVTARTYHRVGSYGSVAGAPRLCRPCVEGTADD